jgi:predicted RNase H-like HicB family nuclease
MGRTKLYSSVSIDKYVALALKHAEYMENDDGTWTVKISVLPGLITFGETKEEAKEMAEDAVRGWVKIAKEFGDEIPEIEGCVVP